MDPQMYAALDLMEARAERVMARYRATGRNASADAVAVLLDRMLATAYELDGYLDGCRVERAA